MFKTTTNPAKVIDVQIYNKLREDHLCPNLQQSAKVIYVKTTTNTAKVIYVKTSNKYSQGHRCPNLQQSHIYKKKKKTKIKPAKVIYVQTT